MPSTMPAETLAECEFETNVLVIGYIAAIYANSDQSAPIRRWGREWYTKPIPLGNDLVTATQSVQMIQGKRVNGVKLVIRKNHYRSELGASITQHFIPFDKLRNCILKVEALLLD